MAQMNAWKGSYAYDIALSTANLYSASVSNGSGLSLLVRVQVQTEPLPNWQSRMSMNPNCQLGYGSMVNFHPVWIG